MIEEKITLDRKTFKALASETRILILRKIEEHQQTLTDLANELEMSPSTVKEHLDKLLEANLIQIVDKGMKWKYYKLTRKGKKILNPYETKVWIVLSTAFFAMIVALHKLFLNFREFISHTGEIQKGEIETLRYFNKEALMSSTETIKGEALKFPYLELAWLAILILIICICVGYLIKKKNITKVLKR
ncbi:MAG: winged helix-turn-helix domain-containing protein [Candidatus Altiarchaeota archaeon]